MKKQIKASTKPKDQTTRYTGDELKANRNRQMHFEKNKDHYNQIMEKLNQSSFKQEFRLKEQQLEKKQNYEKRLKDLKIHQKQELQYKEFKRHEK